MGMAWHVGTFTKAGDVRTCLSFATDAFNRYGFTTLFSPSQGGYTTIGGNDDVIVQVTCVPQGGNTWIAVTATSTDSSLAETTRNNVRSYIIAETIIDQGSVGNPASG